MKIFTCFLNNVPQSQNHTHKNKRRVPGQDIDRLEQGCAVHPQNKLSTITNVVTVLSSCKACFIRRTIVEFNSDKFQIERIKCDGSASYETN